MIKRVTMFLILSISGGFGSASFAGQSLPLPQLPSLNLTHFHPVIRQQVERSLDAARANPKSADASGHLGMILDAYGEYESAEACYRRASVLDPGSFRWFFYLGWTQAAQGKYKDGIGTLVKALGTKSDYLPARLKLAESLLLDGQLEESNKVYQEIIQQNPDRAEARYGLGRVLAARGNIKEAVESYLRACELFPPYGAAHYGLALCYRKLGDSAGSQQHLSLFERNRTTVPLLEDPLRRDVSELSLSAAEHIRRGTVLEQAGQIEEAIAEQQKALQVNPQSVQARINLISLYGRLSQFEKAVENYQAALALNPSQADIHYNYGVLLLKQGRQQEAQKAFQQALHINPYYAEAHNNLGSLYEQQGQLDEALREFQEALKNRPNYRLAHFHIGRILAHQQEYDDAIQHFLMTLTPEDEETPRYLYALSATYARAGDLLNALRYIRTARDQAAARGQTQLLSSIERDLHTLEETAAKK